MPSTPIATNESDAYDERDPKRFDLDWYDG